MLPIEEVLNQKDDPAQLNEAIEQFLASREEKIQALIAEKATEELLALKAEIQRDITQLKLELAKTRTSISNVSDVRQHYLS